MSSSAWLAPRIALSPKRDRALTALSFLLPLLLWAAVSYTPFIWHPNIEITEPGSVSYFQQGMQIERAAFYEELERQRAAGEVSLTVCARIRFICRHHTKWRLRFIPLSPRSHSGAVSSGYIRVSGTVSRSSSGVSCCLLLLASRWAFCAALSRPYRESRSRSLNFPVFTAPAFGALAVAILGIYDGPKIAIIFIGTFFQQVLVVANTTRQLTSRFWKRRLPLVRTAGSFCSRLSYPASCHSCIEISGSCWAGPGPISLLLSSLAPVRASPGSLHSRHGIRISTMYSPRSS